MNYTEKEQLEQIILRSRKLCQRKERNALRGLSAAAAVLFFSLIGSIGTLGGKSISGSRTDYGSFLLSAETEGYVLVAVLAFLAGVITAVVIQRNRKSGRDNADEEKS